MNSKCPVCESNNIKKFNLYHVFFFKENYHSVCLNCTMVFYQPKKKILYFDGKYRKSKNNIIQNHFFDPWSIISYLRHDNVYQQVAKSKKKINTWLDYGGHNGALLTAIKNKNKKIKTFLADLDPQGLKIAHFLNHKIINLKKKKISSKYDVITLVQVLEHIKKPLELLNSLEKNLNKNGLIYLEVPNAFNFPMSDFSHVNEFNENSLKTLIKKSNFVLFKFGFTMTNNYAHKLDYFYNKKKENLFVILKKNKVKNDIKIKKINIKFFLLRIYIGQNLILLSTANNYAQIAIKSSWHSTRFFLLTVLAFAKTLVQIFNSNFPFIRKKI